MAPVALNTAKKLARRENLPSRVLVLDAEPLVRWSLCTALAHAGFDPVPSTTPEEAREIAAEWPPPRVAVLDIDPDDEGRRLVRDLRRIYPDCRVVVLSTERQHDGAWTCGARVVHKPFDLGEVVRLVTESAESEQSP